MPKIVHCVTDDKFIDGMIEVMDHATDIASHEFVCTSPKPEGLKYVKRTDRVKVVSPRDFVRYIESTGANAVILHNFDSLPSKIIASIPSSIKVLWVAWGYDIYGKLGWERPLIDVPYLYHPLTASFVKKHYRKSLRSFAGFILRYGRKWKAVHRMDYFSGIIPEEYDMIKQNPKNTLFRARPLEYHYFSYSSQFTEENLKQPYVMGEDIQLGNSCDPTNNHLDALRLLGQCNLKGRKIYVPLSYPPHDEYRKEVESCGRQLFGDRFIPLTAFLPKEEYFKILSTTRYCIFFHERQQAMGNIYTALWNGCMVFLSRNSILWNFFHSRGYEVFTLQDDLWRIEQRQSLSEASIRHNRELMVKYGSQQRRMEQMRELLAELVRGD